MKKRRVIDPSLEVPLVALLVKHTMLWEEAKAAVDALNAGSVALLC